MTLAAHKCLWENLGILHRDISIGNILLYRNGESEEAAGLLIDFDFSINENAKGKEVKGGADNRTWTVSDEFKHSDQTGHGLLSGNTAICCHRGNGQLP